ncbi:MAG: UpxY family transcription antiterminator [Saprospiraceae bacterium]|nr:UpxY family transcription antiterminator [Saprospiraceae bacterium]
MMGNPLNRTIFTIYNLVMQSTNLKFDPMQWHVLRVLPRQDAKTAKHLSNLGIEHYLPLRMEHIARKGKIKKQEIPVLSPYMFVKVAASERQLVFGAGSVMDFLKENGQVVKLPAEEVNRIRKICRHGKETEWSQKPVKVGDLVELIRGPLKGLRGIAVEEHGKWQMYVLIEALSQFVRFSIHRSLLRSLGTAKS